MTQPNRKPSLKGTVERGLKSPASSSGLSPAPAPGHFSKYEITFLYSDEGLLSPMQVVQAQERKLASKILECRTCERLVEGRDRPGQPAQASCPSCGGYLAPLLGRELDGYRLEDVLARGGFGTVYLASNVAEPKMKAVVKVLRPDLARSRPELVRIFVEEARLTEEIGQTCWNIVRVSNVREKPWPYFFMEYIRGMTLDAVIRAAGPEGLPLEDAKGYLRGIAKGLAATHAHGRVHRDVKPLNIMVIQSQEMRAEERIKLLDFGLSLSIVREGAKADEAAGEGEREETQEHPKTAEQRRVQLSPAARPDASSLLDRAGTPEYMPPEAFSGRNDPTGDIYSFGVTAYEVFTGESPWGPAPEGQDRGLYWRDAHRNKAPRPLREMRPEVPKWLARVVLRCLEKEPERRIRSADEVLSRLRDPVSAWVWVASAAAAGLLSALLVWVYLSRGEVRDAQWQVAGESAANPLRVWVKSPADLPSLDVLAGAGAGRAVLDGSSASELITCQVEEGRLRVRFREGAELASVLASPIAVWGKGSGFRLEGSIEVGEDDVPPEIGEVQTLEVGEEGPSGRPRDLPEPRRFHPEKLRFAVTVREEHPRSVRLVLDGRDEALGARRESLDDVPFWILSLASLAPGAYHGHIEADDEAGNKASGTPFDFAVDREVSLTLISKDTQELVARRMAFWKLRLDEPLGALSVRPTGSAEPLEHAVFEVTGASALEISKGVESMKPIREPRLLESGRDYLLAVHLPGETKASFELVAKDLATPPSEQTWTLSFHPPVPLARKDIQRVSLKLEGEDSPIELPPPEFQLEKPTRSRRVERLEIELAPGRVLRASLNIGGATKEARVDYKSLLVEDVPLETSEASDSVRNELRLELFDALERSLAVVLAVRTDVRKPDVKVQPSSRGGDVEVWAEANEPLARATCSIKDRELEGSPVDGDAARLRFDLRGISFEEGTHRLRVDAWDQAGWRASVDGEVAVNLDPPQIHPAAPELAPGKLRLEGDELTIEIHDGNGLEYRGATVTFEDPAFPTPIELKIEPAIGNSPNHPVSLLRLPETSSGVMTLRIADRQGSRAEKKWSYELHRMPRWKPHFKWKHGIELVLVPGPGSKDFYVSRCEVTNRAFLAAFRAGVVRKPKFWGDDGALPTYSRDRSSVRGDDFPVVGIAAEDAEAFAEWIGGRLPTYDEWLLAAWKMNNGGSYPWKDKDAGRPYANCYLSWETPGSPFLVVRHDGKMVSGGDGRVFLSGAVEADFDPFAGCTDPVKASLNYSGEILHLIGNVGEIVKDEDGSYAIAGGDFSTRYEDINLQLQERIGLRPYRVPDARTGFRIVIRTSDAPASFRKAAQEQREP